MGEEFKAEGKVRAKTEVGNLSGRSGEGDSAGCGREGRSGVHSDYFFPQTPTKLQLLPPGCLPGSTISCWPPLKLCWPQPPTGLSPTRTCTLEPQALLESQRLDRHHTPFPISRLTGIRRACPFMLGWGSCPPLPCAWVPTRPLSDGGCPEDSPLTLEPMPSSLTSAETASLPKESSAGGSPEREAPC